MALKAKGNIDGLKPRQKKDIDKLFEKKIDPDMIVSPEFAKSLCAVSSEITRQIGVLIDRRGRVYDVFVGDAKGIEMSDFGRYRTSRSRLRGLRLVHTHLGDQPLNSDDLTDLALLRLDSVCALETLPSGLPGKVYTAHLLPFEFEGKLYSEVSYSSVYGLKRDFRFFISELEAEIDYSLRSLETDDKSKRAILVHVSSYPSEKAEASMEELKSLAVSAGIHIVGSVIQKKRNLDPTYVIGKGKLKELFIASLETNANLIVFDGQLSASQMRAVSEKAEIDVIDRTQMILDIFDKRAKTREGKLQVKLAQLRYSLPRLVLKDDFLSRITGGAGGVKSRGPGETKLEVLRRRIRDSISSLERELESISKARQERRKKREKSNMPVVSIVGYTNAGKSTLLNALTSSSTLTEDKMFATLDTATKRVRFPHDRDLIITDTVGFIRDLPPDLLAAFRSTLEEMQDSNLLIHLFDISSPSWQKQIEIVNNILKELALDNIPQILAGNKADLIDPETTLSIEKSSGCVAVSANNKKTLGKLTSIIDRFLWEETL